jgi:hypothetical protein
MSNATQAITPTGKVSYPHVAKPQEPMAGQQGNPKYSMALIFDDAASKSPQFAALKAAVIAAAEDAYPGKGAKMLETGQLKSPFRTDCAAKNYKDCAVFINIRTEKKPGIVFGYKDAATGKAKIIPDDQIEKEIYAGSLGRASVNAFAYNQAGNKGVSLALNNFQKVADGERIDGRQEASEEFADLSSAPAQDLPF